MPTMPNRRMGPGTPGDVIAGRYKVIDEAGRGNFAKVVRAKDLQTNEVVAVKMLSPEYARDAQFELDVLKAITDKDTKNVFKVCKLRSNFKYEGYTCFVFTLLGPSLKHRRCSIKDASARKTFQNLTKQLGRALQYMHFECKLVHTDLKPENILLDGPEDSRSSLGSGWTIVDLGSASFYSERPDSDLISTRPYRAPEVLVGSAWSYAADMWSFGCILYELYTGRTLFDVSNDAQHLQLIQRRIGQVPRWLADTANPKVRHHLFDHDGRLHRSVGMGPALLFTDEFPSEPELVDLLRRLLTYDPATRLRADEVCNHPFVKNVRCNGESAILSRLPPSAYTSGAIRTPGCRSTKRASLEDPLPDEKAEVESSFRSASGSGGSHRDKDPRGADILARRASGSSGSRDPRDMRDMREVDHHFARMALRDGRQMPPGPPGARYAAPPPPAIRPWQQYAGGHPPSRALHAAEDSLRAITAADSALYHKMRPGPPVPPPHGMYQRAPLAHPRHY